MHHKELAADAHDVDYNVRLARLSRPGAAYQLAPYRVHDDLESGRSAANGA
jgi:hypothetical protein